ncbi:MAG: hypothetical protein AAF583_11355 [Pseudomonadota bacterium]
MGSSIHGAPRWFNRLRLASDVAGLDLRETDPLFEFACQPRNLDAVCAFCEQHDLDLSYVLTGEGFPLLGLNSEEERDVAH